MNLVPNSKDDIESCEKLSKADDEDVIAVLPELLEWLQDFNWPVAPLIKTRICALNENIDSYLLPILKGKDDVWKYWVVGELLAGMEGKISDSVAHELARMVNTPSEGELKEMVNRAAIDIIHHIA